MALIDKASLLMVPSTYEAGKLYNVLPSGNRAPDNKGGAGYDQTRADFDFDRGSNTAATRVNADGLIEKYRENLLLNSNQFDTTWSSINTTETSGQADKDGGTDAWLISKSASGARVQQAISVTGVQTFSVYAKANASNWIALWTNVGTSYFDLSSGTKGSTGASTTIGSAMESVGNGWYRCSLIFNTSISNVRIYPADGDLDTSGTTGSIYIQNAQLESGLVSTDYLDSTSVTGKAGVLVDLPRINFDANGENGSLLLEPSRQQLVPESEWFGTYGSNANGTGSLPLVYTNNATSPDGYKNATKIVFDAGSGTTTGDESQISKNIGGLTTGADYTLSFYAKGENGGEEIVARAVSGGYTKFTLTTEWKRYELTQSAASTSYAIWFGVRQGLGGIGTINSNATIWLWGVQEEAGSYPSSYIPNHGESGGVTRAADSCSVTGASDVIGQTEGTFVMNLNYKHNQINTPLFETSKTNSNIYALVLSDFKIRFWITLSGSNEVVITTSTIPSEGNHKLAVAYKQNDACFYLDGVLVGNDTSCSIPAVSELYLNQPNADVFEFIHFNERLENAELATLTTL